MNHRLLISMTPIANAANAITMTTAKPTPSTTTVVSLLQEGATCSSALSSADAAAGLLPGSGSNGPTLSVVAETTFESIDDATILETAQKC